MNDAAVNETRRSAIDLHNQGVLAAQTDRSLAYRLIGSSVEIDPTFAQGWFQVGCANGDMNLLAGAVAAFRRVLELEPNNVRALVNAGHRLYHMGQHREARKFTQRAIDIEPENAMAWCNLSLIESVEGRMGKAVAAARKAYEIDKDPTIETALAFALMFAGRYAEGLKHFEARFPYKLPHFLNYPYPQWRGEDLTGKTLYVQAEQGLGDTMSFLRFIPAVAHPRLADEPPRIVMAVQPELVSLFIMMLKPWPLIEITPLPGPFPQADFWTTMTSLPVALGLTDAEIAAAPNLAIPALAAPAPWKAPGRALHVGICWAGAAQNEIDRWRSLRVEPFLDLYKVPGIQLYSLQVGERANDLHAAGAATLIKDLAPYIRDVVDSVAILRHLDLVITVESFLGHLCGAIEMPCWVMVGYNGGDFRLGRTGNKSLWNPHHRLFRQGVDAEWGPVMSHVVDALRKIVAEKSR